MNWGKTVLLAIIIALLTSFSLYSLFTLDSKTSIKNSKSTEPVEPWIVEIVPPGGSIFSVLEKQGLPLKEIALLSFSFGDYIDVTTIQPGDTLKIMLSLDKQHIEKMMFVQEPTLRHHFTVKGDSLAYNLEALPITKQQRIIKGALQGTLDATLLAMGLSPRDKQNINNGLEGEINFQRNARNGDQFEVFVEERIFEGKTLPGKTIYYVQYSGERTGTHELFRFEDKEADSVLNGLYNLEGKSNTASGVGFPLSVCHVVSQFGKRIDPFFGRWAFHQGVDYRARYGTPIYAVANGSVTSASYSGGWGNQIRIKHPSGLTTLYAHLSSISVRNGQTVKKGQVIGRVGSTGRSTGAHLHFSLLKGKSFINPSNLKMVGAEKLTDAQMIEFKHQQEQIRANMMNLSKPQQVVSSK
ncbi:MAG: peptidoglycan DD-metalloendopeptidase family protein [Candidatus Cloacimonetes bacterium]|nr:peptidoglycan DD-metalloendopeptidase family protein [Candidatus Cloacimonadota bacterium]